MAKAFILRRKKLGRTSTKGIRDYSAGCIISIIRNDRQAPPADLNLWAIRWGCTSNIPQKKVLNTAHAIHSVNDKIAFRNLLKGTELCPRTWDSGKQFYQDVGEKIPISVIVRSNFHAQGRNLFFCKTHDEVISAIKKLAPQHHYISEFINKVAEYRVFVCQGRVVWVAQKTPGNPADIAWNVARGGRFDNVRWNDWPLRVVKAAIDAFNKTELDFGGVDVMVDADGRPYVLEINSAPSQTSPYRQECVGKVFKFILEKENKERIPLIEEKGGYLKFIHPALDTKAKIGQNQ